MRAETRVFVTPEAAYFLEREAKAVEARGLRAARFRRLPPSVMRVTCAGYHGPAGRLMLETDKTPTFTYVGCGDIPYRWFICEACYLRFMLEGTITGDAAETLRRLDSPAMQIFIERP